MTAPADEAQAKAEAAARAEESITPACACSAPGKAFLLGEYAVLEGAPAVVAAVTCRARGRFVLGAQPASRLIIEAARAVDADADAHEKDAPRGAVVVDTRAFSDARGRKLGTGSSAAVAAVAVAVLRERAEHGRGKRHAKGSTAAFPPAFSDAERAVLFRLADRAHRASQGGLGSGADVAAAVFGGLICFSRDGASDFGASTAEVAPPAVRRMRWPAGLEVLWFSAPLSASTPAFVAEVNAYAAGAPENHREHLRALRDQAEAGIAAFEAGTLREVLEQVAAYGVTMGKLGVAAGVPIVIPAFADAAQLARTLGGAAKPSGAGGGDIGVALFADAASRQSFADRLPQLGLTPLPLQLDLAGTAREADASQENPHA